MRERNYMPTDVGIIKAKDFNDVISKLQNDHWDLNTFPIEIIIEGKGKEYISISCGSASPNEIFLLVLEGVVFHPTKLFEFKTKKNPPTLSDPPGIVPYLSTAYQISGAAKDKVYPSPIDVGVPLLTAGRGETREYGVVWTLIPSDKVKQIDNLLTIRLWKSVAETEEDLPNDIKEFFNEMVEVPKRSKGKTKRSKEKEKIRRKDYIIKIRSGTKAPSPAHCFPEDLETVKERLEVKYWEPEKARCVEAANSWRVVIPSTSKNVVSAILPPVFTVINDVFNIVIFGDQGKAAVTLGLLLSTKKAREHLALYSSWVQGETPRPRVMQVRGVLSELSGLVPEICDGFRSEIDKLRNYIQVFYHLQVDYLRRWSIYNKYDKNVLKIRDAYKNISGKISTIGNIRGVLIEDEGKDTLSFTLLGSKGQVKIGFSDPSHYASAALASWLGAGLGLPTRDYLNLPLLAELSPDEVSAITSLLGGFFSEVRDQIEREFLS